MAGDKIFTLYYNYVFTYSELITLRDKSTFH